MKPSQPPHKTEAALVRSSAADCKSYNTLHYKQPAIIAVSYKVNSEQSVLQQSGWRFYF